MALKLPDAEGVVKFLIVGMVVLFLITNVININAIGKGTCSNSAYTSKATCTDNSGTWTSEDIYNDTVDYDELIPGVYKWLIVGMASWLAWTFTVGGGLTGRLDRKKFITLIVMAVILYVVYNKILVGAGFLDLPPIEFAAYQLQSIVVP
jgi:hypothetical protein